jgi:hypothetical protein
VFVLGAAVGGHAAPLSPNEESEKRGIACRNVSLLGGTYVGCATHIDNTDAYTGPQSHSAYQLVGGWYAGHPKIVGGDFNLAYSAPHEPHMWDWYGTYVEADNGTSVCGPPTCNEPTEGSQKIDYLFAGGDSYARVGGNVVTSDGWSDHGHYYGTFDG